jgi:xanthine dehydrogenase accessory factor
MSVDIEVLRQAQRWIEGGQAVALATVVSTWGSAPRRPGSLLATTAAGEFVGSVSGGCVENAVIEAASEVIKTGTPTLLEFGVTDELAWEVGLACGGRVSVKVERVG